MRIAKRSRYSTSFLTYTYLAINLFLACRKDDGSIKENLSVTLIHTLPSALHESSGLCFTDGKLWSFGDSGNPPSLFCIDTTTGDIRQTVTIQNFDNKDWEDITADDEYIYIGDFGNNNGDRKDLRVLRISKKDINTTAADVTVYADAIYFSYADQTDFTANSRSDFNCEALATINDSLYLFSKDESDFRTRCYKLSKTPGTYIISPVSSFNCEGEISSAAYNLATRELALGGYENGKKNPFIWLLTDFVGDEFFDGDRHQFFLSDNNESWQTEGLDYISANRLFLSCETTNDIEASLYLVRPE